MTPHLTDDDLVLHYYGELGPDEDARAADHLGACAACRATCDRLQRVLAAVDEAAVAAEEPGPGFERTVWARLQPSLERRPSRGLSWFARSPARLAWAAAVVTLVTGAYFAGRMAPRPAPGPAEGAPINAEQLRERILLVDLGDHLDRSQMVLVELVATDGAGGADISLERSRAEQLVAANRIYRQTASETGDAAVVQLLDELERVLVDIAASPETLSADDLLDVQQRIESRGLLFKVRVLSSEVRERQRTAIRERTGGRSAL
jgi:hypothetical protein